MRRDLNLGAAADRLERRLSHPLEHHGGFVRRRFQSSEVEEAIDFWNRTFSELRISLRLGAVRHVVGTLPKRTSGRVRRERNPCPRLGSSEPHGSASSHSLSMSFPGISSSCSPTHASSLSPPESAAAAWSRSRTRTSNPLHCPTFSETLWRTNSGTRSGSSTTLTPPCLCAAAQRHVAQSSTRPTPALFPLTGAERTRCNVFTNDDAALIVDSEQIESRAGLAMRSSSCGYWDTTVHTSPPWGDPTNKPTNNANVHYPFSREGTRANSLQRNKHRIISPRFAIDTSSGTAATILFRPTLSRARTMPGLKDCPKSTVTGCGMAARRPHAMSSRRPSSTRCDARPLDRRMPRRGSRTGPIHRAPVALKPDGRPRREPLRRAVGRLVQNEQPWGPNQAGGESYAAPLAKRQTPETLVGNAEKPKRPDLFGSRRRRPLSASTMASHSDARKYSGNPRAPVHTDVGKRFDAGCSQRKTCDPYFAGVRDRDADHDT